MLSFSKRNIKGAKITSIHDRIVRMFAKIVECVRNCEDLPLRLLSQKVSLSEFEDHTLILPLNDLSVNLQCMIVCCFPDFRRLNLRNIFNTHEFYVKLHAA
uniref:Uncharacterized protein n=1 Tax=Cacopsylla melanoneura TaxID=428564 RepID=A0A8D8VNE1_9HEMI